MSSFNKLCLLLLRGVLADVENTVWLHNPPNKVLGRVLLYTVFENTVEFSGMLVNFS